MSRNNVNVDSKGSDAALIGVALGVIAISAVVIYKEYS